MCATLKKCLTTLGSYEVVFVDDGSVDATLMALRGAAAQDPAVRYVSFTRNFGHQPLCAPVCVTRVGAV
jgi:dolichol-phosphate mannosyltransferase